MAKGKIPAKNNPYADGVFALASFVLGDEAANARNVAIQLKDAQGRDIAQRAAVEFYLSDDANGDTLTTTAVTTLAAGTDGVFIGDGVTGKSGKLISEADGDIDLVITDTSGARTLYLVLVMPDGSLVVSQVITFAA